MKFFIITLAALPSMLMALTKVYVTSSNAVITVLNADNNTFIKNFTPSTGGVDALNLQGVAISPDQSTAYVVDSGRLGMWIINTVNDTTQGFVALPASIPIQVNVTPDGSKVYVSDRNAGIIFAIQTSDNSVTSITGGPVKPSGLAFNPSGTKLYVSDAAAFASEISVYNTANNAFITGITGSRANFIAINALGIGYEPQTTSIDISTFDTNTDTASASIATTGSNLDGVAFTSDGRTAYVASNEDSTLQVIIDGVYDRAISLSHQPWQVAINPSNENQIYSTANPNSTVMVIENGVEISAPDFDTHLSSAIYLAYIFLVSPPTFLQGAVINNRFVLQTDIVHRLSWRASTSSDITGYTITCNGVQIATVDGLSYDNHNRSPGVSDFYQVRSVDAYGNQSDPVAIYIP